MILKYGVLMIYELHIYVHVLSSSKDIKMASPLPSCLGTVLSTY